MDVAEEDVQRPLVLLVAARGADLPGREPLRGGPGFGGPGVRALGPVVQGLPRSRAPPRGGGRRAGASLARRRDGEVEHVAQRESGAGAADELRGRVRRHTRPGEPSGHREREAHRRIEMAARERAERAGVDNVRFLLADAGNFPEIPDASVDVAGAFDFLEHITDATLRRMAAEVRRVLRSGGRFVAYTPNREHLVERLKARNLILTQQPDHIAVRRPGGAHQRAAGTGVVTDLRVLRRREPGRSPDPTTWEQARLTDLDGHQVPVNEYFLANPDAVLGRLGAVNGAYRADDLVVIPGGDTLAAFTAALDRLAESAQARALTWTPPARPPPPIPDPSLIHLPAPPRRRGIS